MKPARPLYFVLAFVLLFGLAVGYRTLTLSRLERYGERSLQTVLGPGTYTVSLQSDTWSLIQGRLNNVSVQGRKVVLKDGVPIDDMDVEMYGLRFSGQTITELQEVQFTVHLTQDSINTYLRGRTRKDPIPVLLLQQDRLRLEARERFLNQRIPGFEMDGMLSSPDGVRIDFTPQAIQVGPVAGTPAALALVSLALNPVFDTSKLPYGIHVDQLKIQPSVLTLTGTSHPPLPIKL